MGETYLPNFPFEIKLPYAPDHKLQFENPGAVREWAEREHESFASIAPVKRVVNDIWSIQLRKLERIIKSSRAIIIFIEAADDEGSLEDVLQNRPGELGNLEHELRTQLSDFSNGTQITTLHPNFPLIAHFAKLNQFNVARAILAASIGNGLLGPSQPNFNNDSPLLINALLHLLSRSLDSDFNLRRWDTELHALHSRFSERNEKNGEMHQLIEGALIAQSNHFKKTREEQSKEWESHKESVAEEWKSMKDLYDNKMALAAPTTYWKDRSDLHRRSTRNFAIAFSVLVVGSLSAFICWGIPYLSAIPAIKGQSAIVSILPVLIPAFALVWVLRILARQLSENMTLMQDAKERVTMVMTFLALMRDEETGKSVVTNEDRILILHSLFRPSAVTASDDSPPLSVFERVLPKSR